MTTHELVRANGSLIPDPDRNRRCDRRLRDRRPLRELVASGELGTLAVTRASHNYDELTQIKSGFSFDLRCLLYGGNRAMPIDGDLPASGVQTPAELRELANLARRLATGIIGYEDAMRLLAFAKELEARAEAMEIAGVRSP